MISKGTIIENQIYDKIFELEKKHNIKLSTTQKILLSIGGPITTILDALFGKVYLFMLNQEIIKADKDIAEVLEINEGDDVDFREVIVHRMAALWFMLSHTFRCQDACLE